jgi:hypothetical protein
MIGFSSMVLMFLFNMMLMCFFSLFLFLFHKYPLPVPPKRELIKILCDGQLNPAIVQLWLLR